MIRHEVDNHFHTGFVRALNELLKLLHTLWHLNGEVGIDIVIIGNRVRRACPTLYDCRMVLGNAIA